MKHETTEVEPKVIAVDLDGTLIHTDLLHESMFALMRQSPLLLFKVPVWLLDGRARVKRETAARVTIDASSLPYNISLLEWLTEQRSKGRRLVLATGSDAQLAHAVASHLGIFDAVLASDGEQNLTGAKKRDALVDACGADAFCYVGNADVDVQVWATAETAVVVSRSVLLLEKAASVTHIERTFTPPAGGGRQWFKALRLHQWLKNILVAVPLLAAHRGLDYSTLVAALLAFLSFGFAASSVYLLNDLLDLADDRHHRSKKMRPFAAGRLSLLHGVIAVPILFVLSLGIAAFLPWRFVVVLVTYYLLTFLYSMYLKRLVMIDVVALAALYTLRIIGGAVTVAVPLSFWLLAFSMFIFLSLALLKRYSELVEMKRAGRLAKALGRGYHVNDLSLLVSLGAAAGYAAVMVLALYINSESVVVLYREPRAIWFACPLLLFWISRAWLIAHRGEMHDDPVIYAVRDNTSRVVAVLLALSFWFAL